MSIKEKLIGKKLNSILRIMNISVFNFGDEIEANGMSRMEYSIHIKTDWRMIKDGKIALAAADMYAPWGVPAIPEDWDCLGIGRSDEESSIFDVESRKFVENFGGIAVKDFEMTDNCDFKLTFQDGTVLETFIAFSRKDEFWKFVDAAQDETTAFFEMEDLTAPTWDEFLGTDANNNMKN